MTVIRKKVCYADERGEITDIIEGIKVDSITILTTAKGSVRANHYHKKTTQYTYLLEGKCRYYRRVPGEKVVSRIVRKGDLVVSPPLEEHAFRALEDTVLLAFCSGPRAGAQYETDTFRLEVPIARVEAPKAAGRRRAK